MSSGNRSPIRAVNNLNLPLSLQEEDYILDDEEKQIIYGNSKSFSNTSIPYADYSNNRYLNPLSLELNSPMRRWEFVYTVSGAIALFLSGLILFIIGLVWAFSNHKGYMVFIIVGLVLLIPGSYSTYNIYGMLMGWQGFEYESISNWHNEPG